LESLDAGAQRVVVDDITDCVSTTDSRARVDALLLLTTSLLLRTVCVGDALWTTVDVGVSLGVALAALAGGHVVPGRAVGVGSARRRVARVAGHGLPRWWRLRNQRASCEGVTAVSLPAVAHGHVLLHAALRKVAANAGTGVHALVAFTGLGLVAV